MNTSEPSRIAPAGIVRLAAFGVVGATAALVHLLVVSVLVPFGMHPLVANIVAFSVAFGVSFAGHSRWTFPAKGRERPRALHRFFTVALSSFVMNELLYALLLRFTRLGYREALVIVLVIVASSTFIASKYWAFAHEPA
jgi:putative flippase GtrA